MMPPIGKLIGHVDFSNLFIALDGKHYDSLQLAKAAAAPTVNYGVFINNVVNFVIVAFVVFIVVQQMNRLFTKPAPAAAPTTKDCPYCAMPVPIAAKRCGHCTSQL
jgi:large conductance mechanosensitive channel